MLHLYDSLHENGLSALDPSNCINIYRDPFQTSYGNLILSLYNDTNYLTRKCSGSVCDVFPVQAGATDTWFSRINNTQFAISECWAERTEEHCSIRYSLPIALIVVIFNFLKIVLFCAVAFTIHEDPLVTMGDAVSSFLKRPDDTTRDMCLMSRLDFENERTVWETGYGPRFYVAKVRRWSNAASKKRWATCCAM
jgi:hypothetical protein